MPHPIVQGNVLRNNYWVQASFSQAGMFGLHWLCTGVTGTPTTDFDAVTVLDTALAAPIKGLLNTQVEYRGSTMQLINILPLPVMQAATARAGNGTATGLAMPQQVSGIMTAYTAVAGSKGRGRIFMPFPAVSEDADPGMPSSAYVAALLAFGNLMLPNFTIPNAASTGSATLALVVYNRIPATTQLITSWVARAKWATQKRRGVYGRANQSPI
jgi:hypothetical protein